MLGLSKPGSTPLQQTLNPTPPQLSASFLPSLAPLKSPTTTTTQAMLFDTACASSVSPSLSPVKEKPHRAEAKSSEIRRPKAMRLSQLLTDDSPPDTSSFKTDDICVQERQQPAQLPHLPQLSVHVGASAPLRMAIVTTEPVTPPFSPPVLPSLSTVAGLALRPSAVSQNQNALPAGTSWFPPSLARTRNTSSVLCSKENNMPLTPINVGGQTVPGLKNRGTTDSVKKIVKRPYKKYYSNPTPSSHCHVCARTSKAVKFAICARISEGLCRKVTCYKCFLKFGWDWEAAVNSKTWLCVHCRGVCPEGRSQCYIYSRVNSKRESKRKRGKAMAGVVRPV